MSLDDSSQVDRAAALMVEVSELCDAVRSMTAQHPHRVRSELITRFKEISPVLLNIQDRLIDEEREMPASVADLLLDYRRLQRQVDGTLDALDRQIEERQALSTRRSSSFELNDRFDRSTPSQFSQVRKSYDGWRRRP